MNAFFRYALAALLIPGPAFACGFVHTCFVPKKVVVVKQQAAFIAVQAQPYALYQASYDPNRYQQQSADGLQLIADEIKLLREEVKNLKGGAAQQPAEQQASFAQVLTDSCVKCHAAAVAKDKGGEFVLVDKDNKLVPLSVQEKARIVKRVKANSMPPKGEKPLIDAQKNAVVEGLQ